MRRRLEHVVVHDSQLEDLLDDTPFDITTLSRDPEGDQSDGLSAALERLDTFHIDGQTLELQLERVEARLPLGLDSRR